MSGQPSLLVTVVLALVVAVWGAVCWLTSWVHTPSEVTMATSHLGHCEAEVVAVKPKAKDRSPSYSREDTRILNRRVTNNTNLTVSISR